jgi:hypothetical protein
MFMLRLGFPRGYVYVSLSFGGYLRVSLEFWWLTSLLGIKQAGELLKKWFAGLFFASFGLRE